MLRRFETEAIAVIMRRITSHEWQWIGSSVLEIENDEQPDEEQRSDVAALFALEHERISLDQADFDRARQLQLLGIKQNDALHLAAAEKGRCNAFLTTDDRLIAAAMRLSSILKVTVKNPVDWVLEELTKCALKYCLCSKCIGVVCKLSPKRSDRLITFVLCKCTGPGKATTQRNAPNGSTAIRWTNSFKKFESSKRKNEPDSPFFSVNKE